MTVEELIDELLTFPGGTKVIIARDEEGNGFGTYIDVGSYYIPLGEGKHGYIDSTIHPDDIGPDNEWEDDEVEHVVVIWP